MKKTEFINALRRKLSGFPEKEVDDRLSFYSEAIDDRIEEGLSEEDAIKEIGTVDEIYSQVVKEIPLLKIVKEKMKPERRIKPWEIILISLGSPIWFSLLVAAFAVLLSIYVSLWSVIVALWSVFAAVAVCAPILVVMSIAMIISGSAVSGIALFGGGITCAGVAIFAYFGCFEVTKGIVLLTNRIVPVIKKIFAKKEKV